LNNISQGGKNHKYKYLRIPDKICEVYINQMDNICLPCFNRTYVMDFLSEKTFLDNHAGCTMKLTVMKITTVSVAMVKPPPILLAIRSNILSTTNQVEAFILYTSKA
jgi:hypothetical protein